MNIQAEAADRDDIDDIWRIHVRNKQRRDGAAALDRRVRIVLGPADHQPLQQLPLRHHQRRAGARASAPARRWRRWSRSRRRRCRAGYGFEWTGTAFQEKQAAGQTGIILGLAVLFAYLFLVALYESWIIPVPVLLSVAVGVLGAIVGIWIARPGLDLYAQIGWWC